MERDPALEILLAWLNTLPQTADGEVQPATDDASFRRYYRVSAGNKSFIAMEASRDAQSLDRFIRVAGYLQTIGVHVPEILAQNLKQGFLLLSDLGSTQYLNPLRVNPNNALPLYNDALRALRRIQEGGIAFQSLLPPYDEKLLRGELSIFREWLCTEHLGLTFSDEDEANWNTLCDLLVNSAQAQPRVFVHRDFHSRNLMRTKSNNPGILDFQDAVEGPLTYDLVSLLKDCYIKWPTQLVQEWMKQVYARLLPLVKNDLNEKQFVLFFDLMGVQRHLKAAGIFARLKHRDNKPGYLNDIPRTLGYIVDLKGEYNELDWLISFIQTKCYPVLEDAS